MAIFFSILAVGLFLFLWVKVRALEDTVWVLKRELSALRRARDNQSQAGQVPVPTVTPTLPPAPQNTIPAEQTESPSPMLAKVPVATPIVSPPPGVTYRTQVPSQPAATPTLVQVEPSVKAPTPPRPRSRSREEWEILIGGNIFNRIGAVALVIAIALFLKYAFDNGWIHPNPTSRVISGMLLGIALLIGGARSYRKDLMIFAQGIIGAGIGVLYLSVYAAYDFYHLIPLSLALFAMFAVTLVAFWQALRYDSLAIALLGWVGGFLTPIILRPVAPNALTASGIGLFSYLFFFNLGIYALQLKKQRWIILEPLTLCGSYVLFGMWLFRTQNITPAIPLTSMSAIWLLDHIVQIYRCVKAPKTIDGSRLFWAIFSSSAYALVVLILLLDNHHAWLAPAFAIIGLAHALSAGMLARKYANRLISGNLVLAIVFFAVATAWQFHGFHLVIAWSLEAVLLVWGGLAWKERVIWQSALWLFGAAVLRLLTIDGALAFEPIGRFTPVLNLRCLTFMVLAGAIAASALLCRRWRVGGDMLGAMLHYTWSTLVFVLLSVEINDYFSSMHAHGADRLPFSGMRFMVLAVVWTLYSLPLARLGVKTRINALRYAGLCALFLGVLAIAIRGVSYDPLAQFMPMINMRAIPFLLVTLGLWVQSHWLARDGKDDAVLTALAQMGQVICAVLVFELLTIETIDLCRKEMLVPSWKMRQTWHYAIFAFLPIVWTLFSLALSRISARMDEGKHLCYSAVIAQWCAILAVALSLIHYAPISQFHPVLNLRVLAFVIVMSGMLLQARQYAPLFPSLRTWTPVIVALLLFQLCSQETWDYYARLIVVAPERGFAHLNDLRQTAISVTWLVYSISLLAYGFWRKVPALRVMAIISFLFTIGKISLYYLLMPNMLYRIISFAGLGLTLLATSYLYQRYKSLILIPKPDERVKETSGEER